MYENTVTEDLNTESLIKAIKKMKEIKSSTGLKLTIQPNMFIFPWLPLNEEQEKEE